MRIFPTIEELRAMGINQLKTVDIETKEQEDIVQKVYDEKVVTEPTPLIYSVDVPDIKTPADEAIWQAEIDKAVEKSKPELYSVVADTKIEEAVKELEAVQKEVEATLAPISHETSEEVIVTATPIDATIPKVEKPPFCTECDSKARFHKAGCINRTKK